MASNSMIKNNKYYVPPPELIGTFKELLIPLCSAGAGRIVDKDGLPESPWTPGLLATEITKIESNIIGIDLRTVQRWFQENETGISSDNIRWLARIFGCNDPEATGDWQLALNTARLRSIAQRKKRTKRSISNLDSQSELLPSDAPRPRERFNLANGTEALFCGQSFLNLPIVVISGAVALGLISFTLNIHSVVLTQISGLEKQVGFLWAPNWTVVFLALLPIYLSWLIGLLRNWKFVWRPCIEPVDKTLWVSWETKVSSASQTYWAVLFLTVIIASIYNWTATHLIPLLNGNTGGWPVDWGIIAILRPDIISVTSAIIFTGLVFLYNAFCSGLFFTGLVLINVMVNDYLEVANNRQSISMDEPQLHSEQVAFNLMNGVFRCTCIGLIITVMMKLQSSFLQSESVNIVDWLVSDILYSVNLRDSFDDSISPLRSSPGHIYSFFCVLAIFGTFVSASARMRFALINLDLLSSGDRLPQKWNIMNATMLLLVTCYFSIGSFNGFTIVLLLSLAVSIYFIIKPPLFPGNLIIESLDEKKYCDG